MILRALPLLAAFALCASSASAATDKYRLVVTADACRGVTIAWNQRSGHDPYVVYYPRDAAVAGAPPPAGQSTTAHPDHQTSFRGMDNRFVRLRGLRAGTAYAFEVVDSEGRSGPLWFETAPADGSPLRFVAGGDSRNNRGPRRNANQLVAKLRPHAVLFGGDMTDGDTDAEWADWLDDWQLTTHADGRMTPIVPARGNHEQPTTIHELFWTPRDAVYATTWGADLACVLTLNTEVSVAGDQAEWLRRALDSAASATYRFAQYHRPMRPHNRWKHDDARVYAAWAPLFFAADVQLAFDSDTHVAKVTYPVRPASGADSEEGFARAADGEGTVYAGEGCWGAPLRAADDAKSWTRYSGSLNHFNYVTVTPQRVELRTVCTDNVAEVGELDPALGPAALPARLHVVDDLVTYIAGEPDDPHAPALDETQPESEGQVSASAEACNHGATPRVLPYPNPTRGRVDIAADPPPRRVQLLDPAGCVLEEVGGATPLDLAGYPPGTYALRIFLADGRVVVRAVVRG